MKLDSGLENSSSIFLGGCSGLEADFSAPPSFDLPITNDVSMIEIFNFVCCSDGLV